MDWLAWKVVHLSSSWEEHVHMKKGSTAAGTQGVRAAAFLLWLPPNLS